MNNPLEDVLEKVGRVLSDRCGIRVICQGNRCCTDGKVIYLPALPDTVPPELMGAIRAFLDHEVGHIVGASDNELGGRFRKAHGEDAFSVLNALEDLRVEEVMRGIYAGCRVNLLAGYEFAVRLLSAQADSLQPIKQITTAIYSRGSGHDDLPFLDQGTYALCDEVDREIRASVKAKDTAEVTELAERVWSAIQKSAPEHRGRDKGMNRQTSKCSTEGAVSGPSPPQEEAASEPSRRKAPLGGGDAQEGKTPDPQHEDGAPTARQEGPPDPQNTPSEAQKVPSRQNVNEAPSVSVPSQKAPSGSGRSTGPQKVPSRHEGTSPDPSSFGSRSSAAGGAGSHGPMGDLAELIERGVAQYVAATHAYRAWTTEFDRIEVASCKRQHDHQAMLAGMMPYVGGVRQRLLQSLQAEANCRWFGDRESGCVDPKSLHRLTLETSSRVFRQKVRSRTKSTAATLLIDLSSSMRGQKLDLAMKTAIVFCEALERLAIPSSVIGFSTAESDLLKRVAEQMGVKESELVRQYRFVPLRHTVFKRFEEPWRKISGRFVTVHSQNLTPLGESLLFAAKGIAPRREERKIILALTDGKPVVGIDPEDVTFSHAKNAISRIEKTGIEVVLIGIMEPSVERLHRKSVIVRSIQELPGTVIRQLQSILMKGISHDTARS